MILIEIAGFLGADAEVRFTTTGKRVVELRVAVRVKQGNKEDTLWWRVSVWDERLDKMLPYLKKGTAVIVVGDMMLPETYVAKDGATKISLSMRGEMVKFSPFGKPDKEQSGGGARENSYSSSNKQMVEEGQGAEMAYSGFGGSEGFTGDDLPF